jgi:hypothetical protein
MSASSFQRELQTSDTSIQSYNFGGLNTTANRLNTPYTDATVLLNTNTGLDGSLVKRKGSKLLTTAGTVTTSSTALTTTLGYDYLITVSDRDLRVYSVDGDTSSQVRSWVNVYSPQVSITSTPVNWVQLPDTYSRVLGLKDDAPPVEVYAVEGRYRITTPTPANTVNIVATKFAGDNSSATVSSFTDMVYITRGDGVKQRYQLNYTYNISTTTYTFNLPFSTLTGESLVIDIVGLRWAWWTESIKWQGDRLFDTISRFNVTANDNSVAIPPALRSDVIIGQESMVQLVSRTSNATDAYTFANQPTTPDQYNLSDGSVYVPGTNNFINQSLFFLTFGGVRTPLPQPSESVKFVRARELRFRGNKGLPCDNMRVTVNDRIIPQSFSGVLTVGLASSYWTYAPNVTLNTAPSQIARYLAFASSTPMGVNAVDIVTMSNVVNTRVSGLPIELEESLFKSGAYVRCYGIGQFASYDPAIHSYPSTGCVYQGRLCLSGVSVDKARILLSGVGEGQERYTFYQITDDLDNLPSDPLDVVISGGDSADFIVGMVEWNNSLFTLTRRSVYRVSGGDQPLTSTRRLVTYISNVGLVNAKCLVRTDTAVYYLSDGGVFNLTPRSEDSEFNAIEKSLKIRDAFIDTPSDRLTTNASMLFNARYRRLYVAIPNSDDLAGVSSDLYVLDTVRDSWTLYRTLGNFGVRALSNINNNKNRQLGVVALTTYGIILLEADDVFTDRTITYTGVSTVNDGVVVGTAVDSVAGGQRYRIPKAIQTSTISSINDLVVYVGNNSTPAKVEFTKSNDTVYLKEPTLGGQLVWFVSRNPCNDSAQGLVRYGQGDRYPYTVTVNSRVVNATTESLLFIPVAKLATVQLSVSCTPSDIVTVSNNYYAQYVSSMFTQQQLGTFKRTKHAYLYFNNGDDTRLTQGVFSEEYLTRVNCNVAMMYDSDDSDAVTSVDVYGFQDIVWDNAYFDTPESSYRSNQFSLFKEPLIGIGYSYRLCVFSYDEARWHLVGYQITSSGKGLRYTDTV